MTALAKAIREKQVSSREAVRAHLERIAKVNGKVNALTVILEESALGRISRTASTIYPDYPRFYEQTACVNGPMARHIMDLRLALDLMSRPDPGDPWWTPALRLGANTPDPIRVAVSIDPTGAGGYSSVAAGIRRAATILSDAGYAIKKIDPPRVADLPYIIKCLSNVVIKSYLPEILPNYIPGCPERSGRSYKG